MKLSDYLDAAGETEAEFATRIGRSREAVRRYCAGERIPDRDTMPIIFRATGKQVSANDFFGIEPEAPAEPDQPKAA